MQLKHKQIGLSLVELMVGIAVGLLVTAAVISIYMIALRGSTNATNNIKLNQELRSALTLMVNDLRRSGYWGGAILNGVASGAVNPFDTLTISSDGSCVLYSYDRDSSGGARALNEHYGFKRDGNVLRMRLSVTNVGNTGCSDGTWEQVTDLGGVEITNLAFATVETDTSLPVASSQCRNLTQGISWQLSPSALNASVTQPCSATSTQVAMNPNETGSTTPPAYTTPATGDRLYESRMVKITLSGRLTNDPSNVMTLSEQVKIMNDRLITQP